jgi:MinD-like ATPase involved in chromosome partitioning or flagellar assembly
VNPESRVLTVAVAGGGASWEADVLDEIRRSKRLHLRRRCLDVPELLSLSGLCDVAVVSTGLPGLDVESVLTLQRDGVRVIGLGDEVRGRQLGISILAVPGHIEACVESPTESTTQEETGHLVAVWGPHGAPGRSIMAASLAAAWSGPDQLVTLVDADSRGGSLAQMHAVLDDTSGLVAACRSANGGDLATIARHAVLLEPGLRLLTGVVRADMWEQVREVPFQLVIRAVADTSDVVVIDLGPALDVPTRHVLTIADRVVVVGRCDPVGLARVVRSLHDLASVRTGESLPPVVVMNQLRSGAAWSARDVADAVGRLAGVEPDVFVPSDFATVDTAVLRGTVPARIAPGSAFATALGELVDRLGPLGARAVR